MKARLVAVILLALITSGCGSKWPERKSKSPAPTSETQQTQQTKPAQDPVAETLPVPTDVPPRNDTPPKATTPPITLPNQVTEAPPVTDPPHPDRSVEAARKAVAGAKPDVTVAVGASGEPVLQIRYPWQAFPRPSLQIAWADKPGELDSLKPLVLDGSEAQRQWQRQVDRINDPKYSGSAEPVTSSLMFILKKDGRPITLRARVNSLGKEAAYAIDDISGDALVFYLLPCWADDTGVVKIDLNDLDSATDLAKPGKMRVWFFGNEEPIWSETLDWPGTQPAAPVASNPNPPSPANVAPAAPDEESPAPTVQETPAAAPANAQQEPLLTPPAQPVMTPPANVAASGTPPALSTPGTPAPPPKEPAPSSTAPPPRPAATPSQPASVATPDLHRMSIEELVTYIERQYKQAMSPEVRKFWLAGANDYYRGKNPIDTRRLTFMDMLREAYNQKPPQELKAALRVLFFKLQAQQQADSK